jgi:WD40 repeat protein
MEREYFASKTFISTFSSYLFDLVHVDQKYAASSSENTIKLYDTETFQFLFQFDAHRDTINDLVVSSHHPTSLFSASSDRSLGIWDVRSQTLVQRLEGKIRNDFHPEPK